jgi:tetratricopeptide (TPR) repeat protein
MTSRDQQDLRVTATPAAVAMLDRAVADYYGWTGDPVALMYAAVEEDSAFALGHAVLASLYALNGMPGGSEPVQDSLRKAEAAIAGTSTREQRHLAAAKALSRGEMIAATNIWEDILIDHPRDALALRFAHDTYFYLGHSQSIRDSVARVLPAWDRENPNYGFVLGQYAFGLEEMGELSRAERIGFKALEINAKDAWATHAIAHVLETECRQVDGINFLKGSHSNWSSAQALAIHNGWHLALYLIEQGRFLEVLADYDRFIAPKLSGDSLLDLVDAAALLWRLELAGADVGHRWMPLADQWMTHADDHVLVFNDMHIAMAAARSGGDRVKRLKASLDAFAANGSGDNHQITIEVGRTIVDALVAFSEADYRRTTDLLLPIRYKVIRIGGSHAQRDIVMQTLITAADRSGQANLLRNLLAERFAVRPTEKARHALIKAGGRVWKE